MKVKKSVGPEWLGIFLILTLFIELMTVMTYYYMRKAESRRIADNIARMMVFDEKLENVLLAKRKGEQDYDGVYSFIGGKMETTDGSFVKGLIREKTEEVGADVRLSVYTGYTINELFSKKDGNAMVLPHYLAIFKGGDIKLNEEYSDYKWVKVSDIESFEPVIDTVPPMVERFHELAQALYEDQYTDV